MCIFNDISDRQDKIKIALMQVLGVNHHQDILRNFGGRMKIVPKCQAREIIKNIINFSDFKS